MFIKRVVSVRGCRGQGLVEYLVLVALVAVAGIAIVSLVGQNLREQYSRVSDNINGRSSRVKLTEHSTEQIKKRSLADFGEAASK